jgi:hypothetical protein
MSRFKNKWLSIIGEGVFFIAGLFCYWMIITGSHSRQIRLFFTSVVNERTLLLAGIILFLLVTYQIPGWLGRSVRWVGWISLFGVFFVGYWIIKRTAFFQIYGLLPYVDASEYYFNAQRLLLNFPAQGTTIGRPLFTTFFAGILWLCKNDLQTSLIILVALVAFAIYLLQETTLVHFGMLPAAFVASFSFMFYRNYLGGISSESLGLILGCLGCCLLFEAIKKESARYYLGGFFILTLALVTRAGPFFVLAFIFVAFVLYFQGKTQRIQYLVASIAGGGLAFLLNSVILKIVSFGHSYLFPNYLYSLYGMAAGGQGWGYIKDVRPDLMALAEPFRTQQIYAATMELIKASPFVFLWNLLKQYWYFVLYGNTSIYSYLYTNIDWFNLVLMGILYVLFVLTIILLVRNRKSLKSLVVLGVVVGILLSIPFVPPQDESNMRAFAVVVPLMALIPAISLQWLVEKGAGWVGEKFPLLNQGIRPAVESKLVQWAPIAYLIPVLLLAFSPALFLRGASSLYQLSTPTCPAGEIPFVWQNIPGNGVSIQEKTTAGGVNEINTTQLDHLMHDIYMSNEMPLFQSFHAGMTVSEQVNYLDGTSAWVLLPTDQNSHQAGLYQGCGKWNQDIKQYLFEFIQISTAEAISPNK